MFKPEKNDGNIEYKLKLLNKDDNRINELTTQLRFRCEEGNGLCIYFLGVKDDGKHIGLTIDEFNETINTIDKICKNNNYIYKIIDIISIKNKNIYKLLIKENNNNKFIDIKVCIAGCPDSGKTTLVGSLVQSKLDNGRGLLRSSIFNYIHEIKSGRTSSISHQIIGFDENGQNVNKNSINKLSWQQIVNKSSKIISFLDLCGHTKYFKTTILGLTSSFPDFCIVMIDSNNGIKPITKEHIFLLTILQIPFIIVIKMIYIHQYQIFIIIQ
jgi:GTPase